MLLEDYKEGGVDVGALDGIRILDLSRLLPGPYCSMLLADFGAEVIKIEEPGRGDYSRSFPPFQNGFGYWHLQLNRNKKSVVLDLKSDAGRAAFLKLAQTADVVLESYRPGVLKRLGIDYETVSRLNPKIVYCAITGYGKRGPLVDQADHDIGYVSLAGMSILMAVRHAEQTGIGQEIDISLYNTALTLMPGAASLYFGSGFVAERGNNWLTGAYANYNIYETRDGRYVSVGCLEKKFWSNLCLALDRADLIDALDDESQHERVKDELTEIFRTKTMQEWTACLEGKDTCVTPVLNFDEALAAEQTRANAMVLTVEDEEIGTYKQLGFAMKMSATPGTLQKRAPKLGEDTEAVLRGCGLSEAELDLLTKE